MTDKPTHDRSPKGTADERAATTGRTPTRGRDAAPDHVDGPLESLGRAIIDPVVSGAPDGPVDDDKVREAAERNRRGDVDKA